MLSHQTSLGNVKELLYVFLDHSVIKLETITEKIHETHKFVEMKQFLNDMRVKEKSQGNCKTL